jgi:hypothetical protein
MMAKKGSRNTQLVRAPAQPDPGAILQVKTWIVEGQLPADILQSIGEHYPNEAPDNLLAAALTDLSDDHREVDVDAARGFLLNAYREIYRRALEINDFGASLAALKSFERQIPTKNG